MSEPASVFIQCFHNIKAGQNSWVIRSSDHRDLYGFDDCDPHADFFTVRKTEEINLKRVPARDSSYISSGRSLEAKIVMFGVVGDVRKRAFSC